jgi:Type II secretion system (T2SS), protein G
MNTPPFIPTPTSPSANPGQDGLRQREVKTGGIIYTVGAFVVGSSYFSTDFGTPLPIILSVIFMVIPALAMVRAGNRSRRTGGMFALLFACIMIAIATKGLFFLNEQFNRTRAHTTVVSLAAAVKQYKAEYGSLPTGTEAEIVRALLGDNPRKIVFFEPRPKDLNADGELLDPWGTPYYFDFSDPKIQKIYSVGKNKSDDAGADGSDDICSWK